VELVDLIRLLRKWFWLIALAGILGGGVAFLTRSSQPATYQAQATVSVGGFIEAPNPSTTEIRTGVELAQTYAVLATTYDVLEAAIRAGNFQLTPDQLRDLIEVSIIQGTSLLVIKVTYTDPVLAADIANEVAAQMIANSPTNLTPEQQSQIDLANAEIARLNSQLQEARLQLELVDNQLENAASQEDIARLTAQRNVLIDQINLSSATIAQFSSTIASLQQRTNSLDIVERARIPTSASGPGVALSTLFGAVIGVALAVGVALLVEYLDDAIKTPDEAAQITGLPVLGTLIRFGKPGDSYRERLITLNDPTSPVSEGYRALRTNLLFSATENRTKSAFIITSPGPEEGKTVTSANLAVVMASAGLRVLLVDADLRRPKIHELFGLRNDVGLTTLLSANPATREGEDLAPTGDLRQCLQETGIPRLRVITGGFTPSNPAEVLGSALMQRWFRVFQSANNVDVVLFDTPPCLVVADSSVLAATINAPVVLVIEAGRTRRGAAQEAREQFANLNIDVKGVVLNAIKPNTPGYGYGYGGYYYYYSSTDGKAPAPIGGRRGRANKAADVQKQ